MTDSHPSSVWDYPTTDTELDQFYGTTPSTEEIAVAIGEAASNFDDGELGDVVALHFELIADLIAGNNPLALGNLLIQLRRQRIADMASRKVYGNVGFILASQVLV